MRSLRTAVSAIFLFAAFILLLTLDKPTHTQAEGTVTVYLPLVIKPDPFPRGINLLQNASFEGGWYHPGGVPELQIPNAWDFAWQTGPTGYGDNPWDVWVRPEVRVLPSEQLPAHEHPLFIWEGDQTVKVFKGYGAISFTLSQPVQLTPGTYIFELSVFPDLVVGYNEDGSKIWAPDPLSGEVKLLAGRATTNWLLPTFGEKNTYYLVFYIEETQTVQMGAAMRGRYAIRNNGWFMDDWALWKAIGPTLPPGVYGRDNLPLLAADHLTPAEPYLFPVGRPHE